MLPACIALLAGGYALMFVTALPPMPVFVAGLCLALPAFRVCRLAAFVVCGACLAGIAGHARIGDRLPAVLEGQDLVITVQVTGFPRVDEDAVRFVAQPLGADGIPSKVRLTWFEATAIPRIGETWRLHVRLRRPQGVANPGGFDAEGWMFREGIGATGFVRGGRHNYRVVGSERNLIDRLRQHALTRMSDQLPDDSATAVLLAVTLGARHRIADRQWESFAATGTSHLMAISGLHVGLAAFYASALAWILGLLAPGRINVRDVAIVAAVLAAAAYAVLSGFAIPARRAFLMISVAAAVFLTRRSLSSVHVLALIAGVLFVADPTVIMVPGFKLSFAAVAVLLSASAMHPARPNATLLRRVCGRTVNLWRLQIGLLVGLFPIVAIEFGRFTPLAPLVNFLIIPAFAFVTVPCGLAALVVSPLNLSTSTWLLETAHQSVHWTLAAIDVASSLPFSSFHVSRFAAIPVFLLPLAHVLLPPGWPGRRLAVLAMLWLVAWKPARPPAGCVDMHALDVGQGQAVLLQSHSYTLLYDTGPAFPGGGNMAELVLEPFFADMGIRRVDTVVISHGDLDHSGGAALLDRKLNVGRFMVGELIADLSSPQQLCTAGDAWEHDGIYYRVLHPSRRYPWHGNNVSCVVEIAIGASRILIPGDIEAPVEKLLAHRGDLRPTKVVLVPHHGSSTSSSHAFISATRPEIAIVTTAWQNRWGFPRTGVRARWQQAGARLVNTAVDGAISQRICVDGRPATMRRYREIAQRYWHVRRRAPGQ